MSDDNRLRFHAEYSLYSDDIALHIMRGREGVCAPWEFSPLAEGEDTAPATRMSLGAAQGLIDTLWAAGLRPTQGKQSEGVTAAQDRHLQDMRAIAFAKLNVTAPEKV